MVLGPENSVYIAAQETFPFAEYYLVLYRWWFETDSIDRDSVPNYVGPFQKFTVNVDQFYNPVVVGCTQDENFRVNMSAWCWNKDLVRQWHQELRGSQDREEFLSDFVVDKNQRFYAVGGSTDPIAGDRKAVAWRVGTWYQAHPTKVRTVLGRNTSGGVNSLEETDGNGYVVCRYIVPNQNVHPINVEFETKFPIDNVVPGSTSLTMYMTVKTNTSGVLMSAELYDWNAGVWDNEFVTGLSAGNIEIHIPGTGNFSRYFELNTRKVMCRARLKQFGPSALYGYCGNFDEVRWESFPE